MKDVLYEKWFDENVGNGRSYRDCWNAAWDACIKTNAESKPNLEMPVSCKECKIKKCTADMYSSSCKINLIWEYLNKG